MSGPAPIDLKTVVDGGRMNRSRVCILLLILFALFTDGYDITVISFSAPAIAASWGVDQGAMGRVFSIGLAGMILGAAIMGAIGDWSGRRKALIISSVISGLGMLGTATASDMSSLIAWRFVTGLGIGALAPLGIVMATEYAPLRIRATVIACMFLGLGAAGTGAAGWFAAVLLPSHGWQVLFQLGGVLSLGLAGVLYVSLPESIRFLYIKRAPAAQIARIASRLDPDLVIDAATKFVWSGEAPASGKVPYRLLFAEGRQLITPLLWLAMFCAQATAYGLTLWLPTLLDNVGVPAGRIAMAVAMSQVCSVVGGLIISGFIDRYGVIALAVVPFSGIPLVLLIASLGSGSPFLVPAVVATGFSVGTSLQGLFTVSGFFYPTAIRSNGVGAAIFMSRFGSMLGPFLLGLLLARGASIQTVYRACTIPLLLAGVLVFVLGWINRSRCAPQMQAQPPGHQLEPCRSREMV